MKEDIIKFYKEGKSYKNISDLCKCSEYTVWKVVKNSDVEMRGSGNSKTSKINKLAEFSDEAMYWLGYIIADGTVVYNKTTRAYNITLYSKNMKILKKFISFMGFGSIHKWTKDEVYGAVCRNKSIVEWLMSTCNILPNKALNINPYLEINRDLLRGYFDGDGSVRLQDTRGEMKFTTGSRQWAEKISSYLLSNNIYNIISPKENAYDVNIYRKSESKKLYHLMYDNASLFLDYKQARCVALFSNE